MILNIYGSTGEIGKKTLIIIKKYFPKIKINLLCANSNLKVLKKQINIFKPKYVFLSNDDASRKLKSTIKSNTKVLSFAQLCYYLSNSKSDFSILAISGYKSLYYLDYIIKNTRNLGLVNKEAVVSAGHIFKKKKYFKKTKIFPIDSEHFSLFESFNFDNNKNNFEKIVLTASGGPFYNKSYKSLEKISFSDAIKHPKWKMGYKNSIDSATLVNKCLEVVEAHYLFGIPFEKIDIIIHPQALVHSIITKKNFVSNYNLFKNDMSIPIINFFMQSKFKLEKNNKNLYFKMNSQLDFYEVKNQVFPIYNFFKKMNKKNPANLIKFNTGNELAVNMFKNNLIKYTDIIEIIKKVVSIKLNSPLNNIKDIIYYHEKIEKKSKALF